MAHSVHVSISIDDLRDRFSDEQITAKRRLFASHMLEDADKYVPVDTGALQQNRLVSEDGKRLEWSEDYASIVYNMDHVVSASATGGQAYPQWFEVAKQNHLPEWREFIAKEVADG